MFLIVEKSHILFSYNSSITLKNISLDLWYTIYTFWPQVIIQLVHGIQKITKSTYYVSHIKKDHNFQNQIIRMFKVLPKLWENQLKEAD